MRAVAVDWSGARDPAVQRRAIWVAEADDGRLRTLTAGRTREETVAHLLNLAGTAADSVIGLDFSFGFPEWWAHAHDAAGGPDMWRVAADDGEGWLADCAPPFWGRAGRPLPPTAGPQYRRTELGATPRPKSIFQIGGAGQVGTGSIRGMPALIELQRAGLPIWPFDSWPAAGPVVVEAYPRWCTGPVVKSRAGARAAHLSAHWPAVTGSRLERAIASEDAFDAACTALTLSLAAAPGEVCDARDRIEGRVFDPRLHTVRPG